MRITSLLLLYALVACAVPGDRPTMVALTVPGDVALSRIVDSEMVQYRGNDGELWTVVTMRHARVAPGDSLAVEKRTSDKESEFRRMAERYANANAPNRLERKTVASEGVLLALGLQGNRDGKMHSTIEFQADWRDGSQVKGTIEWYGPLEPKVDRYIDHLRTVRLKDRPNPTLEPDAPARRSM